jgi:hypothetical protein
MPETLRERALVRLRNPVDVRFKFLSKSRQDSEQEHVYEGTTQSLSAQGCRLDGIVPRLDWLADILTQKMLFGLNIMLPGETDPIKALGEASWIEKIEEGTGRCVFGLTFREIATADRGRIFSYQIKAQLPSA